MYSTTQLNERIRLLRSRQETMSFNNKMGILVLILFVLFLVYRNTRKQFKKINVSIN